MLLITDEITCKKITVSLDEAMSSYARIYESCGHESLEKQGVEINVRLEIWAIPSDVVKFKFNVILSRDGSVLMKSEIEHRMTTISAVDCMSSGKPIAIDDVVLSHLAMRGGSHAIALLTAVVDGVPVSVVAWLDKRVGLGTVANLAKARSVEL